MPKKARARLTQPKYRDFRGRGTRDRRGKGYKHPKPLSEALSFLHKTVLGQQKSNTVEDCRVGHETKISKEVPPQTSARTKKNPSRIVFHECQKRSATEVEEIGANEAFTEVYNILPPHQEKIPADLHLKDTYVTYVDPKGQKLRKPLRYVRFNNMCYKVLGTLPQSSMLQVTNNTGEEKKLQGKRKVGDHTNTKETTKMSSTNLNGENNSEATVTDESNNIFKNVPLHHWADIYVQEEESGDEGVANEQQGCKLKDDRCFFKEESSNKKRKIEQTEKLQLVNKRFSKQMYPQNSRKEKEVQQTVTGIKGNSDKRKHAETGEHGKTGQEVKANNEETIETSVDVKSEPRIVDIVITIELKKNEPVTETVEMKRAAEAIVNAQTKYQKTIENLYCTTVSDSAAKIRLPKCKNFQSSPLQIHEQKSGQEATLCKGVASEANDYVESRQQSGQTSGLCR